VTFETDERLQLGEFGIQARLVRPGEGPASAARDVVQAEHGQTMVYSTADRLRGPVEEATGRRVARRALLLAEGRRHVLSAAGGTIGRSRDCDIVLSDPNVSRRHAEVRPSGDGGWTVADLGSTNGVRVNGRPANGPHPLRPGDRLELGTAEVVFDLE
jgi:pSer/pThr/pTyr-binding forkhead associated (FHA) protein